MVKNICSILITSHNLETMARFYQDYLGIPLEKEDHGGLDIHYGADIGTLHFGLHPPSNFNQKEAGCASTKIAFTVDDLPKLLDDLDKKGVPLVIPIHDEGFGPTATVSDPDGNLVELVELNYEF